MGVSIIVHGGAKEIPPEKEQANREGCRKAAEAGWAVLERGGTALEAVETAVKVLEDDPTFNAGYGADLNIDGEVQMDAAIMEGKTLKAGAVGYVQDVWHPITLARKVFEKETVFLAGEGASRFAEEQGVERCSNAELITEEKRQKWIEAKSGDKGSKANNTVGCVAIDREGNIVAAASTGGTGNNPAGRVGDTPQIGCGVYADAQCGGTAMTGDGEEIARLVLAKATVDRLQEIGCPDCAAADSIKDLERRLKAEAGCIVLDSQGKVGWFHNSKHMAVAYRTEGAPEVKVFLKKDEER